MNVLQLSTEKSWRGGENQILMLALGLREKGINSHVAFPKGAEALERFRENEFPCLELKTGALTKIFNTGRVAKYCKKNKISLIDAHSSGAHSLALKVKKRLPLIKLVVHRRVAFAPGQSYFSKKKYLSDLIDKYIPISMACAQPLIDIGVGRNRMQIIHSSVDMEVVEKIDRDHAAAQLREHLGIPKGQLIIGSASALSAEKGIHVLLRAAKKLKEKGYHFSVAIAGEGELEQYLKDMAKRYEIEEIVHFMGFVENVPLFLAGVDIFAMPSLQEGLGTSALQAMAAKCAVVASNAGGLMEVIEHGESGLIAKKTSATELSQHIETLFNDDSYRGMMAWQGYDRVETKFNLTNMLVSTKRIYEHLLNG